MGCAVVQKWRSCRQVFGLMDKVWRKLNHAKQPTNRCFPNRLPIQCIDATFVSIYRCWAVWELLKFAIC